MSDQIIVPDRRPLLIPERLIVRPGRLQPELVIFNPGNIEEEVKLKSSIFRLTWESQIRGTHFKD